MCLSDGIALVSKMYDDLRRIWTSHDRYCVTWFVWRLPYSCVTMALWSACSSWYLESCSLCRVARVSDNVRLYMLGLVLQVSRGALSSDSYSRRQRGKNALWKRNPGMELKDDNCTNVILPLVKLSSCKFRNKSWLLIQFSYPIRTRSPGRSRVRFAGRPEIEWAQVKSSRSMLRADRSARP